MLAKLHLLFAGALVLLPMVHVGTVVPAKDTGLDLDLSSSTGRTLVERDTSGPCRSCGLLKLNVRQPGKPVPTCRYCLLGT